MGLGPEPVNYICVPIKNRGGGQKLLFFPKWALLEKLNISHPTCFIIERLELQSSQPAIGTLSMDNMMQAGAGVVSK